MVKRKSDGSRFVLKRMFIEDQAPEDQAEVMNEIKVRLEKKGSRFQPSSSLFV